MFEYLLRLIDSLIKELRAKTRFRFWFTSISLLIGCITTVLYVFSRLFDYSRFSELAQDIFLFPMLLFGFLGFVGLISYTSISISNESELFLTELKGIREERHKIQDRLSKTEKTDVLDTIQLSLNQLNEYYAINKSQARNSFRFSVSAVILGLATLVGGIWFFYLDETPNFGLTAISSIAGLLIQFIGAAYFYLYRTSITQLNYFFNQLVKMQDTMLSVRLCEEITPKARQNEMREKVVLALLDRSSLAAPSGVNIPEIPETVQGSNETGDENSEDR